MVEKQYHRFLVEQGKQTGELVLSQYMGIMTDFHEPNPVLYWVDFLASSLIGSGLLYLAALSPNASFMQMASMIISAILLYRSAIFVHEAYHLGLRLKGFSLAYNLMFGFLHKLPTYFYRPHKDHHNVHTYGTINDPEYDTLASYPPFTLIIPLLTMAMFPPFLLIRFGVVPVLLPFIGEKGRLWVFAHCSTLVMNLKYNRKPPSPREKKEWYIQDGCCFLYNSVLIGLMITHILPWKLLGVWMFTMYLMYLLNFYRVVVSHRYVSQHQQLDRKQQILDSVTVEGTPYLFWLFPVGLRYHTLHHLFPLMPYHNLGKAHKVLVNALPENHPYRITLDTSYSESISKLVENYSFSRQTNKGRST
ncbi:MAG: fatty acid desaturase [Alphaproteobacteria bacterium]|nr:fatty acid desaturase [Alphaproteobacteria bacterium]